MGPWPWTGRDPSRTIRPARSGHPDETLGPVRASLFVSNGVRCLVSFLPEAKKGPLRLGAWTRGAILAIALPLLVVALAESIVWLAAILAREDPTLTSTYVRWDSLHYLDIVRRGYFEVPGDPRAADTGWFPGYPYLVRILWHSFGVKPALVGRAVSLAFTLGCLVLLWAELLAAQSRGLAALLVCGLFPGWVYGHAIFPVSMACFFVLAAVALAARGRFNGAGLCGAVAAFTYPVGVLVAVPLAMAALLSKGLERRSRITALLSGVGLTAAGLLAVFAVQASTVGRWDAFIAYQQQFGHGIHNPLATLVDHVQPLFARPFVPEAIPAAETLIVTMLLAAAAWAWWRERSDRRLVDGMLLAFSATMWIFVTGVGPGLSIYRQSALVVAIVPLLARWRPPALAVILAVFAAMGMAMAVLFFQGVLV
jgi:hypothetical protein